jgi:hypothetical protein
MIMKKWMGLIAATAMSLQTIWAQTPPPPDTQPEAVPTPGKPEGAPAVQVNVSPATAEIVKLAESGVGDEVVTSYVNSSQGAFNLSADDIVYLKDVGISESVISVMMSHDKALRNGIAPRAAPAPIQAPVPPPAAQEPVTPPLTPPPTYVSNPPEEVNYFYNDLSPYGTWIELDGVGWCWQPRAVVVNRSWQPYCDSGHWVYSDCGWYWSSYYSWGWAPFHYGRWQSHPRCGWVWTPDRVWGPAWVSWRVAGDRCGWAPLPPLAVFGHDGWRYRGASVSLSFDFGLRPDHFTFVAFRDFGARDLGHHRLDRGEVTRVFNNTTIINNYTVNRNTIVNHGVSIDRVSAESSTRIPRVTVRDQPADRRSDRQTSRPDTERRNVVYRRELPSNPRPPATIVAQKVDDRHPVVHQTPIVSTRVASGSDSTRPGRNREPITSNRSNSEVTQGTRRGNDGRQPMAQPGNAGPAQTDRRGSSREAVTPVPRSVERAPAQPNAPVRQAPANRDAATSRSSERTVTPPLVPQRETPSSREYQPAPRSTSRGESQSYQPVPRSSRGSESQPSYSPPVRSSPSPQYSSPKGSQQSPEARPVPRSEPRQSESRQSSPGPSRSGDDGRGSGSRRDR